MRNGAAKEDWHWDLNPGTAATQREDLAVLKKRKGKNKKRKRGRGTMWFGGEEREPCGFGVLLFATRLR